MVKARAAKSKNQPPVVEELQFRSDNAFLCLLLNRRTKLIQVIDFRAGALPAKRLFIQSVAQREGVEKILILVEKDEVSSWTRVGFVREGTVPGFYKRSDGHLLGCVIGERTASIEVCEESQKLAEKTINSAKKEMKSLEDIHKGINNRKISNKAANAARDAAWARRTALGSFDPFGRDAESMYLEVSPKRGKSNYMFAEYQECFGHSLIEILRQPKTPGDTLAVSAGLNWFIEELKNLDIVSCFSFAPIDDINLSIAFLLSGFRKTGLLAKGVMVNRKRCDGILWSRKIVDTSGIDEHVNLEDDTEEENDEDSEDDL